MKVIIIAQVDNCGYRLFSLTYYAGSVSLLSFAVSPSCRFARVGRDRITTARHGTDAILFPI